MLNEKIAKCPAIVKTSALKIHFSFLCLHGLVFAQTKNTERKLKVIFSETAQPQVTYCIRIRSLYIPRLIKPEAEMSKRLATFHCFKVIYAASFFFVSADHQTFLVRINAWD